MWWLCSESCLHLGYQRIHTVQYDSRQLLRCCHEFSIVQSCQYGVVACYPKCWLAHQNHTNSRILHELTASNSKQPLSYMKPQTNLSLNFSLHGLKEICKICTLYSQKHPRWNKLLSAGWTVACHSPGEGSQSLKTPLARLQISLTHVV